jgi:hypothetical protein
VDNLGLFLQICKLGGDVSPHVLVSGSGFRVQGSGFRVHSGFRVQGSGFRVQGSGFSVRLHILVSGFGFRVVGVRVWGYRV